MTDIVQEKELICICCPRGCHLKAVFENNGWTVTGNSCEKGEAYGKSEVICPSRILTSTVKITGGTYPRCPVKTSAPIPKQMLPDAVRMLNGIDLKSPVHRGDVIIPNIMNTGADLIVTRDM